MYDLRSRLSGVHPLGMGVKWPVRMSTKDLSVNIVDVEGLFSYNCCNFSIRAAMNWYRWLELQLQA